MRIVEDHQKLSDNPLISVLCITYNQRDYIAVALDSFLAQEFNGPIEVIVNDDCSTDGTTQILLDYQKRRPDVFRIITHEENQFSKGKSTMGEFVIPLMRGKYGAMCEGDDYWTDPHKLQYQYDLMTRHPEYVVCCHANENVQAESGTRLSVMRYADHDCVVATRDALSRTQCYSTNSLFTTYQALQDYRASELYRCSCDGDQKMLVYFATHGEIYYIDKIMSAYRFLAKNSTNRSMLNSPEHAKIAARKRDARIELLKAANDATDAVYGPDFVYGIEQMDYLYYKDIRDMRTLRKRWPKQLAQESLPAKVDMFLFTYLPAIHRLVFGMYYRK